MKKIFLLIFIILSSVNANADQLACLSESTANQASEVIKQQDTIVLFCGCCDGDVPQIVKVLGTKVIKDCLFEVVVTYETMDGEIKSESVDLAYVWMEDPDGMQRMGESKLITPLIKAVQELSAEVEKLKNNK